MIKKLTELNAHFWPRQAADGGDRWGLGLMMDCPCGCKFPLYVSFYNPMDGGPPSSGVKWMRIGDTIEGLSLRAGPDNKRYSVLRGEPCPAKWHGYIDNGTATTDLRGHP